MFPTLEECKKYQGEYAYVPVACEMLSDVSTPVEVLKSVMEQAHHSFLLESAEHGKWGRYSFIGYDPVLELTCKDGHLLLKEVNGGRILKDMQVSHPETEIRALQQKYKSPVIQGMPSFTGGLMGYFAYDYFKYSEPRLDAPAKVDEGFSDVDLMLFDKIIAFDHFTQKIVLVVNIPTDGMEAAYEAAETVMKEMKRCILTRSAKAHGGRRIGELKPQFDKAQFCDMVESAKKYIYEGDIFQVVLSNGMAADYEGSLLDVYRQLRILNPSPYMFYLTSETLEVAGASPETLVKLQNGVLHTFPLAGTRPRGADEAEDARLEAELLADEKERAEHNMLVDLGRNDLGKVSRFGSVAVEKYMTVEKYSHVMHIASTVRGEIRADKDGLDAIAAVLPAGTLSGAPKIRACEIIRELEQDKRGIYGGAVGYLDFSGNMDMCIAIRLAYKKDGKVHVRSGAGIVADSVPENEFAECINKAKAVVRAMDAAAGEGGELL
ncbi:MAG: anthranilate synthase component I family protein [Lachnospiraceae bacterium]|nr:anthranilate synthase component I family protein [Lachnospiraceae bacterium]